MSLDLKQKISDIISDNGISISQAMINTIYDLFMLAKPELKLKTSDVNKQSVLLDKIDHAAMEHFDVTPGELYGRFRKRHIVECRQVCMYLARKYSGITLSRVSSRYRKKDHTTVLHSLKTITNLMEKDEIIRDSVNHIENKIKGLASNNLSVAI